MAQTRVSASGRRAEPPAARAGFTLLEVLVVLVLLAALIAIAFPQFAKLYASVALALERGEIERELAELPEKTQLAGHGGVLAGPDTEAATALAAAEVDGGELDREGWRPLRLALPAGWSMTVPKPIRYHFTGACDGGEVVVSRPPLSLHYVLARPLCRPLLANGRAR